MLPWTLLVSVLALSLLVYFTGRVGGSRGKLGVSAPAMTGDERWECLSRVQMNTVEQMVLFLPALWLAAPFIGDRYAAALGAVWIVGRLVYSNAYLNNPKKRGLGMTMTFAPTVVLLVAALVRAVIGVTGAL